MKRQTQALNRLTDRVLNLQQEARELMARSNNRLERYALDHFASALNPAILALAAPCPVCAEAEAVACVHCGAIACPGCQYAAHFPTVAATEEANESERAWRCPRAPKLEQPTQPEEDDITWGDEN